MSEQRKEYAHHAEIKTCADGSVAGVQTLGGKWDACGATAQINP